MDWIVQHAAFIVTKSAVCRDGMTPHERLIGRKWNRFIIEMGENLLTKLALCKIGYGNRNAQKNELAPRSIRAAVVGQVGRTGEHVVIKRDGEAVRCRSVRRR